MKWFVSIEKTLRRSNEGSVPLRVCLVGESSNSKALHGPKKLASYLPLTPLTLRRIFWLAANLIQDEKVAHLLTAVNLCNPWLSYSLICDGPPVPIKFMVISLESVLLGWSTIFRLVQAYKINLPVSRFLENNAAINTMDRQTRRLKVQPRSKRQINRSIDGR